MNVALSDSSSGSQRTRNILLYVLFSAIAVAAIIYGAVTGEYDFLILGSACLLGVIVAAIAGATARGGALEVPGFAWWIIFGIVLVGAILVIVI